MKTIAATGMRGTILFVCLLLYAFPIPAQKKSLPRAPSFTIHDLDNKLISTDGLITPGPLIISQADGKNPTTAVYCRDEQR